MRTRRITTTKTLTLELCGQTCEVDVEIEYQYNPPCRGSRERGSGIQLDPDEPATVDLQSIKRVTYPAGNGRPVAGVDIIDLFRSDTIINIEIALIEEFEEAYE